MTAKDRERLIARNNFCKTPDSEECFSGYFKLLINQAKRSSDLKEKYDLLNLADTSLSVFCEKANLDNEVIKFIDDCHLKLEEQFTKLDELTVKRDNKKIDTIFANNELTIKELRELKDKIASCQSQADLDKHLNKLSELDEKLDKELLTKQQQSQYKELTNLFSKVVSDKVNEFNAIKERRYNSSALTVFHDVYRIYKSDEKKYKGFKGETPALVGRLFKYNSNRLSPEVQMYYNLVYSYIFGKLDDEEKFEMTEMSLQRFSAD